jgi:protein-L-isoaspartate(D-aspartate) O-methyltransferase
MSRKQRLSSIAPPGSGLLLSVGAILLFLAGCGTQAETTAPPVDLTEPAAEPTALPMDLTEPAAEPTPLPATPRQSPAPALSEENEDRLEERMKMVDTQIRRRGVTDEDVLAALERVPRHAFVPDQYQSQAYADHPLPIGHGQTISQPYIVALMTELLELETTDRVLEIGTGSGYQAAILAEIVAEVYTVEIIEPLAIEARERLERLGYDNIHTLHADGYFGWEEHAPYDAIIVTAAPDHIPQPLVQQLEDGAKLVIPVGPPGGYQTLWQITREGEQVKKRNVTGVLFVPLTGEH